MRWCGPGGRPAVGRSSVVGAVDDVGPDRPEPLDGRVERGGVDRLEADRDRVVGRTGLHDDPLGTVVVAPGERAVGRLAGDEADDVGEHRRERVGLRKLEDEVAELDLVVHVESSREVGSALRARRRAGERAVGVRPERLDERAGRVAGGVELLGGDRGDEVGRERDSRCRSGGARAS